VCSAKAGPALIHLECHVEGEALVSQPVEPGGREVGLCHPDLRQHAEHVGEDAAACDGWEGVADRLDEHVRQLGISVAASRAIGLHLFGWCGPSAIGNWWSATRMRSRPPSPREIEPTLLIEDLRLHPTEDLEGHLVGPTVGGASACVAATKSPTHVVVVRTWSTRQIR